MSDIKSPEARSRNMSAIRGKDTKPEVFVRRLLFSRGFRYRLHVSTVPGHPDLWLRRYNAAVFVNGCFWHRHPGCRYACTPGTRSEFWNAKFARNVARDQEVRAQLRSAGIRQLIVWECTVRRMRKDPAYREDVLESMISFLRGNDTFLEI